MRLGLYVALMLGMVATATATPQIEYQAGNIVDLSAGDFAAKTTSTVVLGAPYQTNFGLGAGEGLGEIVQYGSVFYLSSEPSGQVQRYPAGTPVKLSFYTGAQFSPADTQTFQIDGASSLVALENAIDQQLATRYGAEFKDDMFAIDVYGSFDFIVARNENIDHDTSHKVTLSDWMKSNQHVFVDGAGNTVAPANNVHLVIFRSPLSMSKVNEVPYHVHYVDLSSPVKAGHVYALQSFSTLTVRVEKLNECVSLSSANDC